MLIVAGAVISIPAVWIARSEQKLYVPGDRITFPPSPTLIALYVPGVSVKVSRSPPDMLCPPQLMGKAAGKFAGSNGSGTTRGSGLKIGGEMGVSVPSIEPAV